MKKGIKRYEVANGFEEVYTGYSEQAMKDAIYDYIFSSNIEGVTEEDIDNLNIHKLQQAGLNIFIMHIQDWGKIYGKDGKGK